MVTIAIIYDFPDPGETADSSSKRTKSNWRVVIFLTLLFNKCIGRFLSGLR